MKTKGTPTIAAAKVAGLHTGGLNNTVSDHFIPGLTTGAANFSFPLELPASRGMSPRLNLSYSSSNGNDIFGIGFDLSLLNIRRKTIKGVPAYDSTDAFVLSTAGELVQMSEKPQQQTIDGKQYDVTTFRPRHDNAFSDIECWRSNGDPSDCWWVIRTADGQIHFLGDAPVDKKSKNAAIQGVVGDKDNKPVEGVFQWLISHTIDAHGNQINYYYDKDADEDPNRYIERIEYGNYHLKDGKELFAFEVNFRYDTADEKEQPTDKINKKENIVPRTDITQSYRSGFLIKKTRLCHRIELRHHFNDDKTCENVQTKYWHFNYHKDKPHSVLMSIKEVGCIRNTKGEYVTKEKSAVTFDYSTTVTDKKFELKTLATNTVEPNFSGDFQLLDLYREGLPGILYSDEDTALFWRSNGDGTFAEAKQLTSFPVNHGLNNHQYKIMPIGEERALSLVVFNGTYGGFFHMDSASIIPKENEEKMLDIRWGDYTPFERYPTETIAGLDIDITGNGQADIVMLNAIDPHYYPADGDTGYTRATSLQFEKSEKPFPKGGSDEATLRTFSDLFGDGLLHRVEVSAGTLTYWPNLGHGRFGASVDITIPPFSGDEQLKSNQIHLADVDGTGCDDLVYVYPDKIEVYFNSGVEFSETPLPIDLPDGVTISNYDQLNIGDLFGRAQSTLLLSKVTAQRIEHYSLDLWDTKPYLLTKIDRVNGHLTTIDYESSTTAYINDRFDPVNVTMLENTKLPFAMPVIKTVTDEDQVTEVTMIKEYSFHAGNYDFLERQFCGFSLVEQWENETIANQVDANNNNEKTESLGEPANHKYLRSWFACGAYHAKQPFSEELYASLYFDLKDEKKSVDHHLTIQDGDEKNAVREAIFAMRGELVCHEVYDKSSKEIPFQVQHNTYEVICVKQPEQKNKTHGLYIIKPRDIVTYDVEQQESDYRIEHVQNLDWGTDYVNLKKSTHTSYGRKKDVLMKSIDNDLAEAQKEDLDHLSKIQKQDVTVTSDFDYHDSFQVAEQDNPLLVFSFKHVPITSKQLDKNNLIRQKSFFYWGENDGVLKTLPLLHHSEQLVGKEGDLENWHSDVLHSDEKLDTVLQENGYYQRDGGWWLPSRVHHYDKAQYYLVNEITSFALEEKDKNEKAYSLFSKVIIEFDSYQLEQTKITEKFWDSEGKTTNHDTVHSINYQSLAPYKIIDHNKNTLLELYDPLGNLLAQTHFGKLGGKSYGKKIDFDSIYDLTYEKLNLFKDIQDISGQLKVIEDNFTDWLVVDFHHVPQAEKYTEPLYDIKTIQDQYESLPKDLQSLKGNSHSAFRVDIDFHSGYGEIAQSKASTIKRASGGDQQEWLTSGLTLYNSKGLPYEEYLPFYSDHPNFDLKNSEKKVPVLNYYDALDRLVRQVTPKGYLREVHYQAWASAFYDENDQLASTLDMRESSDIIKKRLAWLKGDEEKSLEKQGEFYQHTPTIELYYPTGLSCAKIEFKKEKPGDLTVLVETITRDVLGLVTEYSDPRGIKLDTEYNLLGQTIKRSSPDRGEELFLYHHSGAIARQKHGVWLSRHQYDSWHRHSQSDVLLPDGDDFKWNTTEKKAYGESLEKEKSQINNQCGELIEISGSGSVTRFDSYDLQGNAVVTQQQVTEFTLSKTKADEIDQSTSILEWNEEGEGVSTFTTTTISNPENQVIACQYSNNKHSASYHNAFDHLGQLQSISTTESSDDKKSIIDDIQYNAIGMHTSIKRSNQVNTGYQYDEKSQVLTQIETKKEGQSFQSMALGRDPTNNITSLTRDAFDLSGKTITDTKSEVQYSSLYQITHATGRELVEKPITDNLRDVPMAFDKDIDANNNFENYQQTFSYDSSGNLTTYQHQGVKKWDQNKTLKVGDDSNKLSSADYDKQGAITTLKKNAENTDTFDWNYDQELMHSTTNQANRENDDNNNNNNDDDSTSNKIHEYFGYQKNDEAANFLNTLDSNKSQKYTPTFFKPVMSQAHTGKTIHHGEVTYVDSGRCYRRIYIEKPNGDSEIIEHIYIGAYERKRVWLLAANSNESILTLERYSLKISNGQQPLATLYHWSKDVDQKESNHGASPQVHYHLTDHLNSIVMDLDKKANILTYQEYLPYGSTAFLISADKKYLTISDYHYSGQEREHSGLYYYGARYYAPWLARWLSPDPAGLVDELNMYRFVRSNPITFIDLYGLGAKKKKSALPPKRESKRLKAQIKKWEALHPKPIGVIGHYINGHEKTKAKALVFDNKSTAISLGSNIFKKQSGNLEFSSELTNDHRKIVRDHIKMLEDKKYGKGVFYNTRDGEGRLTFIGGKVIQSWGSDPRPPLPNPVGREEYDDRGHAVTRELHVSLNGQKVDSLDNIFPEHGKMNQGPKAGWEQGLRKYLKHDESGETVYTLHFPQYDGASHRPSKISHVAVQGSKILSAITLNNDPKVLGEHRF